MKSQKTINGKSKFQKLGGGTCPNTVLDGEAPLVFIHGYTCLCTITAIICTFMVIYHSQLGKVVLTKFLDNNIKRLWSSQLAQVTKLYINFQKLVIVPLLDFQNHNGALIIMKQKFAYAPLRIEDSNHDHSFKERKTCLIHLNKAQT